MSTVFDVLMERGYFAQVTHEAEVRDYLSKPGATFYIGFDPTADSLHVGHFLQMMVMAHLQRAGHRPVVLLGGGTGMIGDPSGRSDLRQVMTREIVEYNVARFREQMKILIDFSDGKALLVDNSDWLMNLNYIDFLREIGSQFSVNRMLTAECFKSRLERGLSFLEFNYMLMQAYDFLVLYRTHGCRLQLGGDDQWSNILAGVELVRRKDQGEAYGMTFRLLTTSSGTKMGKTAQGALWLDAEKTAPFEFFQYWRNLDDADVIATMKLLTFMPLEEIAEYAALRDQAVNQAKERLAYEVTRIVHGEHPAEAARRQAAELFGGGGRSETMPTCSVDPARLAGEGVLLLDLLAEAGWVPSKGEGRRLILQGGISLGEHPVHEIDRRLTDADFSDDELIVRKGKKLFYRFRIA